MKIAFVVNAIATEKPTYTTTRLAFAAKRSGHEVWTVAVGDLAQQPDGSITATASQPGDKRYRSLGSFAGDLLRAEEDRPTITVDDLDVLFLRNDPAADAVDRPWAQRAGVHFGQLAAARGVIVVNDPVHLADAIDKTYFQHFPEQVRPATMISRDSDDLKSFVDSHGGRAVLKPLQGSGGQGVFVVDGKDQKNLNQIIESISRDGFVVAQEYLKGAEEGDVRVFVMNGDPLMVDGHYAAFRRRNSTGDARSNMHVGGKAEAVKMTSDMLEVLATIRPKLIADGMFLAGVDMVGNKLMEVNVFSPGGLGSAGALAEADFSSEVIRSLVQKVELRSTYGARLDNAALATL